ncbi:MAG: hypothetical protein OEV78_11895 [Spirochaetia bacterium]|nr:hypothetical protein [Spirochaetia bacterium]
MQNAILTRIKNNLINFANKYGPYIVKKRLFIIITSIIFALILFIPFFLFNIFTAKNKIAQQIQTLSAKNNIIFSSDGIVKGNYRDIVLYNVRINENNEDSNKQPLLTVPELRIIPDIFQSIKNKTLVIKKIVLKDARWRVSGKNDASNKELQDRILNVLRAYSNFDVILLNNMISVMFEKENYERQIWNVLIYKGYIHSVKGKVEVSLYYNDLPWGKGHVIFSPDLCKSCNLFNGKYNIDLNQLPINRISWYFETLKFKNGFIDIKSDVLYLNNGKEDEIDIKSDIQINDILVFDMSNETVLENSHFDLDIKYQNKDEQIQSEFTGKWKKTPFTGFYRKKQKSVYPEIFTFTVDNKKEKTIPLLFGYKLEGLKLFNLDLHEDKENKVYRVLSGSLITSNDGNILDLDNKTLLKIPNTTLNLDNNKFDAILNIIKSQSDLEFSISGTILPVNKIIDTQIEFDDYQKNKSISYNGVIFEINETGKIKSNNLYWKDLKSYYEKVSEIWINKIASDQYKGWRPSIFRERDWFQKYLIRTSFDNTVSIDNWFYIENNEHSIPVMGSLIFKNSILDLQLKSDLQNFNFIIDVNSNTPIIRSDYKLFFTKLDDYSCNWYPSNLISRFNGSTIEGKFNTSGERPTDILNNFNSTTSILLQNAILIIDDKKTSDELKTVNLDIRKYGDKIQMNLNGENDTISISGYGSFEPDKNLWNIKTSVLQKNNFK